MIVNKQLRNVNDHQITLIRGDLSILALDAGGRVGWSTYGLDSGGGAEAAAPMEVGVKASRNSEMTIQ